MNELHPGPRQIRRQNRRTRVQIISRVVIAFISWVSIVILFGWMLTH